MSAAEPADTESLEALVAPLSPGARPGVHAYAARPSGVHGIALEEAVELVRRPNGAEQVVAPLVWIDVQNPDEAAATILRDRLNFHPLAVEDCIRGRQRPKLDRYPGYFFLVLYTTRVNPGRDRMALTELHVFLGERYVVTVHDHKVKEVGEVLARWRAAPSRFDGVGALAHALMDAVVDNYIPVLNHFTERAERVENAVFNQVNGADNMQHILALRREVASLRRVVAPERDVLSTLLRRDLPFFGPELMPYFQDVYDHAIRATEEIDTLRDTLSVILDAHLSASSNQLNQTVRMMTAWSIILMTMAWIAGIYGMNFEHMPELHWRFGYGWALGVMVLVGCALVMFFRRRRWL
jgi:magnesium transporter